MLGAITGDMAGSVFEFRPFKGDWRDVPLLAPGAGFTDDTVLTLAVADAVMKGGGDAELSRNMTDSVRGFARRYPRAGYGGRFAAWIKNSDSGPYNSFGNGSAMRVSPAGWARESLGETERLARISAEITHNHPEGVKGACAVAGAIFLARNGAGKDEIKDYAEKKWGYDLSRPLGSIRENYRFDETCQGSVPEALTAFLESDDYEGAVRKAVWLRGDADTQAAIAGSIASAFYGGVPPELASQALAKLDSFLRGKYLEWENWLKSQKSGK